MFRCFSFVMLLLMRSIEDRANGIERQFKKQDYILDIMISKLV